MQTVLNFLSDLQGHNNREWFEANRQRYVASLDRMLLFTGMLVQEIRRFDPEFPLVEPRDCMFRIYRDVRFSPDKRPYKDYFGSYMAAGGRKSIRAGYYLHLQPGSSLIAGGLWCPSPDVLQACRRDLADNGDEFADIIEKPTFRKYFPEIEGEQLKTAPKGFDRDAPYIHLLRYKSYSFSYPLTDRQIASPTLFCDIVAAFKALYPANRFLNEAIDKWL
ncbi:MAG: DUF2461 domain-containing protein [Bacteroidales bacterium]|jgi:uncharacterized protein (TIGR02453 family)|nr:DUF2461 domain-containing protein [Bacteroidales bacterium]